MDLAQIAIWIAAAAAALGLLWLSLLVIAQGIATAAALFGWAHDHAGAVGVMLYVIVWAVAFPFMLTVCVIGGVLRTFSYLGSIPEGVEKAQRQAKVASRVEARRAGHPKPGDPDHLDWANRRGPYANN